MIVAVGLAVICVNAMIGPYWAMPTAILSGAAAAPGIAFVNSIGNLGRIFRAVRDRNAEVGDGRISRRTTVGGGGADFGGSAGVECADEGTRGGRRLNVGERAGDFCAPQGPGKNCERKWDEDRGEN